MTPEWNYRIVKELVDGKPSMSVRQVYYTEHGHPFSYSETECSPIGDSVKELLTDFELYNLAMEYPVLSTPGDFDMNKHKNMC